MRQEQIKRIPKQREEQIDPMPESIYDQELDALTKLVLEHIDMELGDGTDS